MHRRAVCHATSLCRYCGAAAAAAVVAAAGSRGAVGVGLGGRVRIDLEEDIHVCLTAAGFAGASPLAGRRARLSRRSTAEQQGSAVPGLSAAYRGDHRGDALLRGTTARVAG